MVISTVNQVVYNGDGITTAWPYTFRIIDDTDIKLAILESDGSETDITSDYYVDTVNNTVYYPGYAPGAEPPEEDQPPVLPAGKKLLIYRQLPVTQEKDLGEKWPFEVIELALDKLTMILQQIYEWWGRCLKISPVASAEHPDFDMTFPIEAGKSFRVNAEGTGFEVSDDPGIAAEAAYEALEKAEEAKDAAISAQEAAEAAVALIDLQAVWYDTVADMVADDIPAGNTAGTKGYATVNDGGSATYNIREKTGADVDDGKYIIFLNNGNVAEWVSQNDYLSYKDSNYTEEYTVPVFKSYHQASVEWEAQKALDAAENTLTIATYNTENECDQRCIGDVSNIPLSKRLTVALMTKAQVIGFQEALNGYDVDAMDMYSNLGKFTDGIFAPIKPNVLGGPYTYGDMIQSALTLDDKTYALYPHVANVEDRGYAKVVFTLGDKTISVYNTHLGLNTTERSPQISSLFNTVQADTSDYKIVIGDTNTSNLSELQAFTDAGYTFVNTGQYPTYFHSAAIDNIICSPGISVIESGYIEDTLVPNTLNLGRNSKNAVSDHSPLWARLRFN